MQQNSQSQKGAVLSSAAGGALLVTGASVVGSVVKSGRAATVATFVGSYSRNVASIMGFGAVAIGLWMLYRASKPLEDSED